MSRLLIPYDGSAPSQRAVDYVIKTHAGSASDEVELVNVQEPPMMFGDYMTAPLIEQIESGQREAGEQLLSEARQRLESSGLRVHAQVVSGTISDSIANVAESRACDSIVMGTRGMSSLGNLLLGSVATRVIHDTKVPVTLVK